MNKLFHISTHPALKKATLGTEFTLNPGLHCAEGVGVYFSEGRPVAETTAEGTRSNPITGIVAIEPGAPANWWRSKAAKARKFGKPRTWHTAGKSIVLKVSAIDGQFVHCTFKWS